jgi:autotransporter passenger strand-loop-strand repeat protein
MVGGTESGTAVASGGYLIVMSGGTAFGASIESGGDLIALPGAVVSGASVYQGGNVVSAGVVFIPGSESSVYGAQVELYGTSVSSLNVGSGGAEYVLSGSTANQTSVC